MKLTDEEIREAKDVVDIFVPHIWDDKRSRLFAIINEILESRIVCRHGASLTESGIDLLRHLRKWDGGQE